MARERNKITVDVSSLRLDGSVLDIGVEGRGVIYRCMKHGLVQRDYAETAVTVDPAADIEECSWISGYPTSLPFQDGSFDVVTAFFALSYIKRNHERHKAIGEIARTLKKSGRLYIWDIDISSLSMGLSREMRVLLPGGEALVMDMRRSGFMWGFQAELLLPALERYFCVTEARDREGYFYLEAVKIE